MRKILPIIACSLLLLSSCNGNKESVTIIKDCSIYQNWLLDDKVDVYFFNTTKDVPYLKISEGIPKLSTNTFNYQIVDNTHGIISGIGRSKIYLDLETTTLSYEFFDEISNGGMISDNSEIYDYGKSQIVPSLKIKEESSFTKGNNYSIKLSDYGFHLKKYKDEYYAPIDLISLMFYQPDSYYYENNTIYCLPVVDEEVKKKISFKHTFSQEYYEHCFNIFMLTQELMSGIKGVNRKYVSDNTTHIFFKNGVLSTLLPYKEKIINSATIEDFDKGMMQMLAKELNTGGHDNVNSISFNSKQQYIYGSEYEYTDDKANDIKNERTKSIDKDDFLKFVYSYDTDNDGKNDIGYITFDRFIDKALESNSGNEAPDILTLLNGTNGANTLFNPNSKTYDKTKYDIKDIVVDLSANEGGNPSAMHLLTSWLCQGKLKEALRNPTTGSYNKYSYKYDLNKDGLYNEEDYLPSTINIYVLTSNASYSAANILPFLCDCYNKIENPTNKIKFMGERPGGGCCQIDVPNYLATGFSYYQSRKTVISSYLDPAITSETTINPTSGLELTSLSQMVNHTGENGINSLILSKRNSSI